MRIDSALPEGGNSVWVEESWREDGDRSAVVKLGIKDPKDKTRHGGLNALVSLKELRAALDEVEKDPRLAEADKMVQHWGLMSQNAMSSLSGLEARATKAASERDEAKAKLDEAERIIAHLEDLAARWRDAEGDGSSMLRQAAGELRRAMGKEKLPEEGGVQFTARPLFGEGEHHFMVLEGAAEPMYWSTANRAIYSEAELREKWTDFVVLEGEQ